MTTTKTECPNCSAPLHGQYCSQCGQNQKSTDRFFLVLLNEAFEGIFSWNSKVWQTTKSMFFKPGLLTTEHLSNRRARYISPLRLYIMTSVGFFLTLSLINFFASDMAVNTNIVVNSNNASDTQTQLLTDQSIDTAIQEAFEEENITVNIAFLDDEKETALANSLKARIKNAIKVGATNPKRLIAKIIDNMPAITFFLLPLYALIFKLFFLKSKRYYAEHLILTVHNNSFFFAAYTLILISQLILSPQYSDWLLPLFIVWSNVYLALSFKRVFNQSWPLTIAKTAGISWIYSFLTLMGFLLASFVSIILL